MHYVCAHCGEVLTYHEPTNTVATCATHPDGQIINEPHAIP